MFTLTPIPQSSENCCIYSVLRHSGESEIQEFVVSTPETRAICNDPFVLGMNYTDRLRAAGAKVLTRLRDAEVFTGSERSTHVLTILRGGLNFQIREGLADAFKWNSHGVWFISAQRQLLDNGSGDWEIIEDSYNKIYDSPEVDVIFGDVVATGTSLQHGLQKIRESLSARMECRSLLFFTIGGSNSGDAVTEWKRQVAKELGQDVKCSVVYFEGIFGVAREDTPIQIKLPGTDLLRRDGVMAPEFLRSQYEDPAFPIERCTIYDAGSRAFCIPEYLEDVSHYWGQVAEQAASGISFASIIRERCPELLPERFGGVTLKDVAARQLERIKALL